MNSERKFTTWEEAVVWLRNQPNQRQLVRDSFYDDIHVGSSPNTVLLQPGNANSWSGRIGVAWHDRLGGHRKLLAIVLLFEDEIVLQGNLGSLIARKRRFHAVDGSGDARSVGIDQTRADEFGEIQFLRTDVQVEFEVLRVDLADVQVRDIPHRADREGGIESLLLFYGSGR